MELDAQFFESTLSDGFWANQPFDGVVNAFSQDTRKIGSGDCFVAIKTERRDGHAFLDDAHRQGAIAALVSSPQDNFDLPQYVVPETGRGLQMLAKAHRERFPKRVVGITGSAGKTSTKELIAGLLGSDVCATLGNLNNTLGVPLSLLRLRREDTFGVFEAGIDRPGEMDILADMLRPDIGVVTLVAEAHLERLGSLDGVAREKVKLLKSVPPEGLAIFPAGCLQYEVFNSLDCPSWVVTRDPELNLESVQQTRVPYWTETTNVNYGGVRVCISGPLRSLSKFDLPSMSEGMIENSILAILVAQYLEISDSDIQERLADWQAADQRGQWVESADRRVYVDCYNANPASMLDSARFFDAATTGSTDRTFIIGTMNELGDEAAEIHRGVAKQLPVLASDTVCCVGVEANAICQGILDIYPDHESVQAYAEVGDLLEDWKRMQGDIFLKGSRSIRLERLLEGSSQGEGAVC